MENITKRHIQAGENQDIDYGIWAQTTINIKRRDKFREFLLLITKIRSSY